MCRVKRAFKRHVPGVLGAKATQQDAYFILSDRLSCRLRVCSIIKSVTAGGFPVGKREGIGILRRIFQG